MAGTGIVDADVARMGQGTQQQGILLGVEARFLRDQQAVDLSSGDINSPFAQLLSQQRLGDLLIEARRAGRESSPDIPYYPQTWFEPYRSRRRDCAFSSWRMRPRASARPMADDDRRRDS